MKPIRLVNQTCIHANENQFNDELMKLIESENQLLINVNENHRNINDKLMKLIESGNQL